MKFRAALIASVILAAASQSTFGGFVMGAGTVQCGEWTRLRTFSNDSQTRHEDERASLFQVQAWLDGYVSGVNLASLEGGQPDILASKPQSSALYALIDNHCRANPLDRVIDGAMVLVRELRTRAQR